MNLSNLTKEQKQYVFLGVICVIGAGYLVTMGVNKCLSSASGAVEQLEEVQQKILRGDRVLARSGATLKSLEETKAAIRLQIEQLPPADNRYSWASQVIYTAGRAVGVEVGSVVESSVSRGAKAPKGVCLGAYSIEVQVNCSYADFLRFWAFLEKEQPMLRLANLDISASSNPLLHNVKIRVEWPVGVRALQEGWEEADSKPNGVAMEMSPHYLIAKI